MKWIEPKFSRTQVRKAGSISTNFNDSSIFDLIWAEEVMSNWRAAHAYPMHATLITLRRHAVNVDPGAIVVQRLKRRPSIIKKLERFSSMKLDRMQDIGGCRAVVSTNEMAASLLGRFSDRRTKDQLHKVVDYVHAPQITGYRGYHVIYKYGGTKEAYEGLFTEVQIRSLIQHAWATAVEIIDTYTMQALKSSQGQREWLDFFMYASAEFAKLEGCPVPQTLEGVDTLAELRRLEGSLQALAKLQAYTAYSQHIDKYKVHASNYILLKIDHDARYVSSQLYPNFALDEATREYALLEKLPEEGKNVDAVLISAASVSSLFQAYPNYFADSREFQRLLIKVLDQ